MVKMEERTDPRVARTRKLLEQAFAELLHEKGFQDITIQDIADRATVNRATFYAHFPDKYALLDHFIRREFRNAITEKFGGVGRHDYEKTCSSLAAVFEVVAGILGRCRLLSGNEQLVCKTIKDEISALVLEGVDDILPANRSGQIRRETVASTLSWVIFGAAMDWTHSTKTESAEEMAHQTASLLSEGMLSLMATEES
jgi:AcrR family transcriptional regulator